MRSDIFNNIIQEKDIDIIIYINETNKKRGNESLKLHCMIQGIIGVRIKNDIQGKITNLKYSIKLYGKMFFKIILQAI